jgi:hypothetical protein
VRTAWTASAAGLERELEAFRASLAALQARSAARALPPRRLRGATTEGMATR